MDNLGNKLAKFFLLAVITYITAVGFVSADIINVDKSGTDSFTSIQKALASAVSGDTVKVKSGEYHERIIVPAGVSLIGENPQTTIIDGYLYTYSVRLYNNSSISSFTVTNAKHGIISDSNSEITGNIISRNYNGIYLHRSPAEISNNRIENNNNGIVVYEAASKILHNNIKDNSDNGIIVNGYCPGLEIKHNLIQGKQNGIVLIGGPADIINNTIVDMNFKGISVDSDRFKNRIINNIIAYSNCAIEKAQESFSYNLFWKNGINYKYNSIKLKELGYDPLFVDVESGNFNLSANSPCIDTGSPEILDSDGTRSNIGADLSGDSGFSDINISNENEDYDEINEPAYQEIDGDSSEEITDTTEEISDTTETDRNIIDLSTATVDGQAVIGISTNTPAHYPDILDILIPTLPADTAVTGSGIYYRVYWTRGQKETDYSEPVAVVKDNKIILSTQAASAPVIEDELYRIEVVGISKNKEVKKNPESYIIKIDNNKKKEIVVPGRLIKIIIPENIEKDAVPEKEKEPLVVKVEEKPVKEDEPDGNKTIEAPVEISITKKTEKIEIEKNISIVIPYNDIDQDGYVDGTDIDEKGLIILRYNDQSGEWARNSVTTVDIEENTCSVETDREGKYAIFSQRYFRSDPPVNLEGKLIGAFRAELSWNPSISEEWDIYNIYVDAGSKHEKLYGLHYNIYSDNGSGYINYIKPVKVVTESAGYSWVSEELAPGRYKFAVRVEDVEGHEEKNLEYVVIDIPEPSGSSKATIKTPKAGKRIRGNAVTVKATVAGSAASGVVFQYAVVKDSSVWKDIADMDIKKPYAVYWNVSNIENGEYRLRAVAYDENGYYDAEPVAGNIFIDDVNWDIHEEGNPSVDPNKEHRKRQKVKRDKDTTVIIADGTTVDIPAGAVKEESVLSIKELKRENLKYHEPTENSSLKPVGEYREFKFESGEDVFNKDITISIPYDDDDGDGIIDGTDYAVDDLNIYHLNEKNGKWEEEKDSGKIIEDEIDNDDTNEESGEETEEDDGKDNNGHGNNKDGVDSSNPGEGKGGPNGADDPSGDVDDEGEEGNKDSDVGNSDNVKIDNSEKKDIEKYDAEATGDDEQEIEDNNKDNKSVKEKEKKKSKTKTSDKKTNDNVIKARVNHFSVFGLMASVPVDVLADVVVYPNPFKPNSGLGHENIIFEGLTEEIKIKIYTVSGRLVKKWSGSTAPGYNWEWNGKNSSNEDVAGGIYIYVITSGKRTVTGKAAVIR
ncbi:MAG: right-handed parallel beta-helix repeat-containing protein [Elusimicrobia bacterium]|nr:right-handed parallel beta-helix repeat-containing protein [Elusimicrobiota bacterium]